jgi:bifunctional UDP-N-acetylglucosamine pyrophosphorylase / glucosamine-1-phosphate N-acetyltransferase
MKRMQKAIGAIVMAAGLGKRMRSKRAKVLHPVAGRAMVLYGVELAQRVADDAVVVVVGHQGDQVKRMLDEHAARRAGSPRPALMSRTKGMTAHVKSGRASVPPLLIAEQRQQLGTGHAVMQAREAILRARGGRATTYVILNGDTPLLTDATVRDLLRVHEEEKAAVTILTAVLDDPSGYGRVVRHPAGDRRLIKIVEDRDASEAERAVREVNVGTYVVEGAFLFEALDQLRPSNAQQEYYLTDVVTLAVERGLTVAALKAAHVDEGLGINSREQLAVAERIVRERIRRRWMEEGVSFIDPDTAWVDADVTIGRDTVIHPHVTLEGNTSIGEDCCIRSQSRITNSHLGPRVQILDSCVITEAVVEEDAAVGPFAHLRPGSIVRKKAKVGNFVEMKKTELGEGSKANHLTYLGDSRVGKGVNIGAGTITCNYDGYRKFETVIEDDVFIGSDAQLVAPVKVGRRAVIAAGTTVTQDVPADALAISRMVQANRPGWAAKRRGLLAPNESHDANRAARTRDASPPRPTRGASGTRPRKRTGGR